MVAVKWFSRVGIAILIASILKGNDVGILWSIPIFIITSIFYLFFIEYWYLSIGAGKRNETWWIVAHKFYMESEIDVPYWKFMWWAFVLMLQEDYED